MKTLRFKVGDMARVVLCSEPHGGWRLNAIVEITQVGPVRCFKDNVCLLADYEVKLLDGVVGGCNDAALAPLPPDADHIPPATRSIFNVTPNQGLPVGPRPKVRA